MKHIAFVLVAVCVSAWVVVARADWDRDDPYKWLQLPDPNGWDVNATELRILADDFECTETGWITDIHFWGSWKSDDVGAIQTVFLSIYADVPAGQDPDAPYSHPGEALWSRQFDPATDPGVVIREWGSGEQGWYDPVTGEYSASDHTGIWQVNVFLDREDWFLQEGTAAEPAVYWLSVSVYTADVEEFGWKTSVDHWNDDAVSGGWFGPNHGPPVFDQELLDPVTGESLDLAFVLTGIPIPEPGMLAVGGLGLLALGGLRRRDRE